MIFPPGTSTLRLRGTLGSTGISSNGVGRGVDTCEIPLVFDDHWWYFAARDSWSCYLLMIFWWNLDGIWMMSWWYWHIQIFFGCEVHFVGELRTSLVDSVGYPAASEAKQPPGSGLTCGFMVTSWDLMRLYPLVIYRTIYFWFTYSKG